MEYDARIRIQADLRDLEDQHREMFRLLAQFRQSSTIRNQDDVAALIESIRVYLQDHGSLEVDLMAAAEYAHIEEHVASHEAMLRQLTELGARAKCESVPALAVGVAELAQAVSEHIDTHDRMMVIHLSDAGKAQ